jgi:hypothetical protein
VIVNNWNGYRYSKVPVVGVMSDANILAACQACQLNIPCTGLQGCQYNDPMCLQTNNEDSCPNPMQDLGILLCNVNNPSQCGALWGVYQNMGTNWINGGGCGSEQNQWCSQGANEQNKFALCVQAL